MPNCFSGTMNWKRHCCTGCTTARFPVLACNGTVPSAPSPTAAVCGLAITSFGSSLQALITFCTKTFLVNSLQARPLSQLQLHWLLSPLQTQRWSPGPGPFSPGLAPAGHGSGGQPPSLPCYVCSDKSLLSSKRSPYHNLHLSVCCRLFPWPNGPI